MRGISLELSILGSGHLEACANETRLVVQNVVQLGISQAHDAAALFQVLTANIGDGLRELLLLPGRGGGHRLLDCGLNLALDFGGRDSSRSSGD